MTRGAASMRLAAWLLLALVCAGSRGAAAQSGFESITLAELDSTARRRLVTIASGVLDSGSLDCSMSPYVEQLSINTPGLYQFKVRAIGANANTYGKQGRVGGQQGSKMCVCVWRGWMQVLPLLLRLTDGTTAVPLLQCCRYAPHLRGLPPCACLQT